MGKRKRTLFLAGIGILVLLCGIIGENYLLGKYAEKSVKKEKQAKTEKEYEKESASREAVRVEDLSFSRISDTEIQLQWSDQWDTYVQKYQVERRPAGSTSWEQIGILNSDRIAKDGTLIWMDTVQGERKNQYEYRINVKVKDSKRYQAQEGRTILASTLLICIDPGHYGDKNAVEGAFPYTEGNFTLQLAKSLAGKLKEEYGVSSILTRETADITMGGLTDAELDSTQISLRGEYAKGTDLFLSLHTNANLDGANGYGTAEQPISINKPILLLNRVACKNPDVIRLANEIGNNLAQTSYQLGIAAIGEFDTVEKEEEIRAWTDDYNDQLLVKGTVCRRMDSDEDYYGVLRGAAEAGVPGIIIEHGFHTVPEMRRIAGTGELAEAWAQSDAEGLAKGYGLVKQEQTEEP